MQETETRNFVFLLNNTNKEDLYSILKDMSMHQDLSNLYFKLSEWYVTKKALPKQFIDLTEGIEEPVIITNLPHKGQDSTSIWNGPCTWTVSDNVQLYNIGKIGEWNISSDGYYPYCSLCNKEPEDGAITDVCPNCGADLSKSAQRLKELTDRKWDECN